MTIKWEKNAWPGINNRRFGGKRQKILSLTTIVLSLVDRGEWVNERHWELGFFAFVLILKVFCINKWSL